MITSFLQESLKERVQEARCCEPKKKEDRNHKWISKAIVVCYNQLSEYLVLLPRLTSRPRDSEMLAWLQSIPKFWFYALVFFAWCSADTHPAGGCSQCFRICCAQIQSWGWQDNLKDKVNQKMEEEHRMFKEEMARRKEDQELAKQELIQQQKVEWMLFEKKLGRE